MQSAAGHMTNRLRQVKRENQQCEDKIMMQLLEEYEENLVQVKRASDNTVASYMRDLH